MRSFFAKGTEVTRFNPGTALTRNSYVMSLKITILVLTIAFLIGSSWAQPAFPTSHNDNTRSNANTNETLLTPLNVNSGSFGHLLSLPVDYQVMAQPLYVPQVNFPGQGTHNALYVVTQNDSVYAFDADSGEVLWNVSLAGGGAPASGSLLPCGTLGGFNKEGIVGTPVIDLNANTMYLVAKTAINGTVMHFLHALDITTGLDQQSMNSPVQIIAKSVSLKGHVTNFTSLHQKNRPGALLLNGVLYLGFGSNGCNDSNSGWVLAYDPSSLQQLGVFNTSPDIGLTSIWQTGSGLAGDDEGNIFLSTAESGNYDVPSGGQSFSNSILKLTPPPWSPQNQVESNSQPADYFTPWTVSYLNHNDLDVSSTSPLILPDLQGPYQHELVAAGKQAVVYVLNRDMLGMYAANDDQIIQEYPLQAAGELMASPAYWNGMIYYTPDGSPLQVLQVQPSGAISPIAETKTRLTGAHAPSISANGNSNGILWVISSAQLQAYDAVSLKQLYTSNQAPNKRDKLPGLPHFATQTVVNGKVYVGAVGTVEVYGLLGNLTVIGGNNQAAPILTTLPMPLQVLANDPYSGLPKAGITVNFSDGGKGGTFSPASAVTAGDGTASTTYTFPKTAGTYTLTASATSCGSVTATETATPLAATTIIAYGGGQQTGQAGSILLKPLVVQALDIYKNPVPGVTVNFSPNAGVVSPTSAVTAGSKGQASVTLQLPTTVMTVKVTASAAGLKSVNFSEYSVAGPAASITATGGNNQSGTVGNGLAQGLSVLVQDQYGNPVPSVAVAFSDGGAGGVFTSGNPLNTNGSGSATQNYVLPKTSGTVIVTASVSGVTNSAGFTETALPGPATQIVVSSGNGQTGTVGTALTQSLIAMVEDQYGNPVAAVGVTFSDGGAGGVFGNPNPENSDATGAATQTYTLPQAAGNVTITATAVAVVNPATFTETAGAGAAVAIAVSAGNNQFAPGGSTLPQSLNVIVSDQYNNPVPGVAVTFSDGGAGGSFSFSNPENTGSTGIASQIYTLPPQPGPVTIAATAAGVSTPAFFTETGW